MGTLKFAFCESVTASSSSPWHIRPLEKTEELRLTGGVDTESLCGLIKPPYGWDLGVRFSSTLVSSRSTRVCARCRDRYEDYLRVGDLYFEHEGKKYVRMRDIDGLEKQVLEKLARFEWYSLHHPTAERPAYLLEFEMRRRLHVKSQRWFNPETFRLYVPKEKVSEKLLEALLSPPNAPSSTGTSSGQRVKPSARKTTSASQR